MPSHRHGRRLPAGEIVTERTIFPPGTVFVDERGAVGVGGELLLPTIGR